MYELITDRVETDHILTEYGLLRIIRFDLDYFELRFLEHSIYKSIHLCSKFRI